MVKSLSPLVIIKDRLTTALTPCSVTVNDDSDHHRGHQGYRPGQITHVHVSICAVCLAGMTRLEQHRTVYRAIGQDIMNSIHSVSLHIQQ